MNSFEYDFSASIKYHEERLKKCSASFFDAEPRSSQYKRNLQSCINYCLLDNILKRVQSNDPDCYESIINDVNGLFDFLDVVLNLDSSDSFNDLFKEKISTEGVSSLLFVFSLIVSRDSFIRVIKLPEFSNSKYLFFLIKLWESSIVLPSFDSKCYESLSVICIENSDKVLIDFLYNWPSLLKKELVPYSYYRFNSISSEGHWPGDDCYVVMLLSFLFAVDNFLDPQEEYLPTHLMPLFKERFPLYGVLSNASLRESALTVPPAVKNTDIHPYAKTILSEDEAFIVSAIYAYSTVEYVTEVLKHLDESEDLMEFVSMLNCSECEVDGFTSDEIYFSIEVDHKDRESAMEFLNRAASYIYGSTFEFDLLACDTVHETIQTFNRALEPLGGLVYSLDTGCDNYLFFITDSANKAQLDRIFEEV